jgi:hypothetical protein
MVRTWVVLVNTPFLNPTYLANITIPFPLATLNTTYQPPNPPQLNPIKRKKITKLSSIEFKTNLGKKNLINQPVNHFHQRR